MSNRKTLIAGNWKMNLTLDESVQLVKAISGSICGLEGIEVLVAPPFTSLPVVKQAIGEEGIFLGAQNMYWEPNGAYTGEISGPIVGKQLRAVLYWHVRHSRGVHRLLHHVDQ